MSTYAVFGMTRHKALEMAKRDTQDKSHETEAQWLARVQKAADDIMQSDQTTQLSEKFDSPQFAREFMELARKHESRHLQIKAWCKSGHRSEKTGREMMHWVAI